MLAERTTDYRPTDLGRRLKYVIELTSIAIIYVALAKLSLALASIHPSATPISRPQEFAGGFVDFLLAGAPAILDDTASPRGLTP